MKSFRRFFLGEIVTTDRKVSRRFKDMFLTPMPNKFRALTLVLQAHERLFSCSTGTKSMSP